MEIHHDQQQAQTGLEKRRMAEEKHYALPRDLVTEFPWNICEFEQFLSRLFVKSVDFFLKWDLEKIMTLGIQWQDKLQWTAIYIIANNHSTLKKQASIGRIGICVRVHFFFHIFKGLARLAQRFRQHNGTASPGANNRKLYGHCRLVFFMTLPPLRNFSSSEIIHQCRTGRGWNSRCQRAIQIAHAKALPFYVSREVFQQDSDFYSDAIVEQIRKLFPEQSTRELYVENRIKNLFD